MFQLHNFKVTKTTQITRIEIVVHCKDKKERKLKKKCYLKWCELFGNMTGSYSSFKFSIMSMLSKAIDILSFVVAMMELLVDLGTLSLPTSKNYRSTYEIHLCTRT